MGVLVRMDSLAIARGPASLFPLQSTHLALGLIHAFLSLLRPSSDIDVHVVHPLWGALSRASFDWSF